MVTLNSHKQSSAEIVSDQLIEINAYNIIMKIAQKYKTSHEHMYVMGGSVRNAILGKTIKDIDFFLNESLLNKILKDETLWSGQLKIGQLGSPRWIHNDSPEYIDLVPLEKVSHGFGSCKNIRETIKRMDITINSIAFNPFTKKIYDPSGGLIDIEKRIVKMVRFDIPQIAINEKTSLTWRECLWFRVVHYAEILKMDIDQDTYRWLEQNSDSMNSFKEFSRVMFIPKITVTNKILKSR